MGEKDSAEGKEQPKPADAKNIGTEIDLFVAQVDSLAETLPLSTAAIDAARNAQGEKLKRFVEELGLVPGETKGRKIPTGQVLRLYEISKKIGSTLLAAQLVRRSLLVSLVSQFDAYIGRVVRQLFVAKPGILNSSGSTLTFQRLSSFGSLEDAREYVVEKEIESLLRKSHAEHFVWLEAKFGLTLRDNLAAWPLFIEVTERRNLFVHTNGTVSHQYLEVCRENRCAVPDDLRTGQLLSIDDDYFARAYECLFEIGVKLGQVLWRKVVPEQMSEADQSLAAVTYTLLSEERYRLACVVLDFATETLKKHSSDERRLIMVVNRALAYKWSGDEEMCQKIVNSEDWSATGLKFKMAHSVLLNDFEGAFGLMKRIGADGKDIEKDAYRFWPLFKEIRKSTKFAETFELIFNEPFNLHEVDNRNVQMPPPALLN